MTLILASLYRVFPFFTQSTPIPYCIHLKFGPFLPGCLIYACKLCIRWLNRKRHSMSSNIFRMKRDQSYSNRDSADMVECGKFVVQCVGGCIRKLWRKVLTQNKGRNWKWRQKKIILQKMDRSMGEKKCWCWRKLWSRISEFWYRSDHTPRLWQRASLGFSCKVCAWTYLSSSILCESDLWKRCRYIFPLYSWLPIWTQKPRRKGQGPEFAMGGPGGRPGPGAGGGGR